MEGNGLPLHSRSLHAHLLKPATGAAGHTCTVKVVNSLLCPKWFASLVG